MSLLALSDLFEYLCYGSVYAQAGRDGGGGEVPSTWKAPWSCHCLVLSDDVHPRTFIIDSDLHTAFSTNN